MIIGHKLNFMTVDFDAQMQYFMFYILKPFNPLSYKISPKNKILYNWL